MKILFLILLFCYSSLGQQPTQKRDVFQDEQFPYSIEYPSGWAKVEPFNPNQRLRLINSGGRGTAQITITVSYRKQNEKYTSAEMVNMVSERPELISAILKQGSPNWKVIENGKTFLDSREAFFIKSEDSIKTLDLVQERVVFQVLMLFEGNTYILHFSDTKESFDKSFQQFKAIAASFHVLPTKAKAMLAKNPQLDRWHDLIFDVSPPSDAFTILGTPSSDKLDVLPVNLIGKWLSPEAGGKQFRVMEYGKIANFDRVTLAFLNNRLVFIELAPKKLLPSEMSNIYNVKLTPALDNFDRSSDPQTFVNGYQENTSSIYPSSYSMIGISDKTFLIGKIVNGDLSDNSGNSANKGMMFPGEVKQIQIISRSLQK
jgi:hypothetical protein